MLSQIRKVFNDHDPDVSWFNNALSPELRKYSPDYGLLEQFEFQLLFVYDDMMYNRKKMQVSSSWFRLAGAFTRNEYTMFTRKAGLETYPIPLRNISNSVPARIKGEIWLVRPKEFLWLDKQKENTVSFIRKRVHVKVPYRKQMWSNVYPRQRITSVQTKKVEVWMYVGMNEHWEPLLDGGYLFGQASRYHPNNPKIPDYYYFSTRDYET